MRRTETCEINAKRQANHEAKLKEWTARKALRAITLVQQHAEVDGSRDELEARQPDGLVECWSHVLFASEYPEGFPKSFALALWSRHKTVVSYKLPTLHVCPA